MFALCTDQKACWCIKLCFRHTLNKGTFDVIMVPLLGKVKGESYACQHLLHSVALTSSGIPIKLWYMRLLRVHRGYGRTKGPVVCDKDGFQLGSRDMNLKFWEALTHIWEQTPKLFLSNIKTADVNVYQSFRWGMDSRAIEQGLGKRRLQILSTIGRLSKGLGVQNLFTDPCHSIMRMQTF
jgi:hypothetical protein